MTYRIPLVVIGGFLGAGKTTLLNHLLTSTGGRRIAVLVNDFGPINVDAELIAEHDGETLSLTNGCICCSVGSGFEDGLIRVLERRPPMDLIVVEASGVSDPARIAQVGLSDPMLQLEAIVVMVDGEQILEQLDDPLLNDTLVRQMGSASLLVLNKADLVSREHLNQVRDRVTQQFGSMAIVEAAHARVPIDSLAGNDRQQGVPTWPGEEGEVVSQSASDLTRRDNIGNVPAHNDNHDHGHGTPDHPFDRGSWSGTGVLNADVLIAALKQLPRTIIRAKGWVTTDRHGPAIVHLAGGRVRIDRAPQDRGRTTNELVYIGMRDADIHAVVRDAFATLMN